MQTGNFRSYYITHPSLVTKSNPTGRHTAVFARSKRQVQETGAYEEFAASIIEAGGKAKDIQIVEFDLSEDEFFGGNY